MSPRRLGRHLGANAGRGALRPGSSGCRRYRWHQYSCRMNWDRMWLKQHHFEGFVRFAELPGSFVPSGAGVYVVFRESVKSPAFLDVSCGGHFKGRDPTAPIALLQAAWVPDAQVLNIGKAALGSSGRRGLKTRLGEYQRYGEGQAVGHAGGRYIWQLADSSQLLVAWLQTPGQDPKPIENRLIADFARQYGKRPFANLTGG